MSEKPYNTYIQDYRKGGILSDEDAQKYNQTNNGKSDTENEESIKSENC